MNREHVDLPIAARSGLYIEKAHTRLVRPAHLLAVLYVLLAIGIFLALIPWVHGHPYSAIDLSITRALQSLRNPLLDFLMETAGLPGLFPQVVALNVLIIVILFLCRLRWPALTLALCGPVVGLSSNWLRYMIDRPRPSSDLVWVAQQIENGHYSFPSGHVLGFTAIFGFLWYLGFRLARPSWTRTALLVAYGALIALVYVSRVYVGEHWATDVLGAFLVGSVYLVGIIAFYEWRPMRGAYRARPRSAASGPSADPSVLPATAHARSPQDSERKPPPA